MVWDKMIKITSENETRRLTVVSTHELYLIGEVIFVREKYDAWLLFSYRVEMYQKELKLPLNKDTFT